MVRDNNDINIFYTQSVIIVIAIYAYGKTGSKLFIDILIDLKALVIMFRRTGCSMVRNASQTLKQHWFNVSRFVLLKQIHSLNFVKCAATELV